VPDETIEAWLDQEIQYAENAMGMQRSYRQPYEVEHARWTALKDVRHKMEELWGISPRAS
jgi:isopentenyldiphosphate isomerase